MNLSGNWRYCTEDNPDFSQPDFDDSAWKTMSIPANWFLGGLDHHGVVWFRHEFSYRPHHGLASLHFDGIDYFSDVYLNGVHLGHHIGYFEPFAFEVDGVLKPGKNNLAVRVESPYEKPGLDGWHLRKKLIKGVLNHHDCRPGGGWEPIGQSYNTGGIWNRVYIEEHGPVTIEQMLLRADLETGKPVLHIELTVHNRTEKREAVLEVRCAPENFKGKAKTAEFALKLPTGKSVHSLQIPVNNARIWQPWDRGFPHLYKVSAALTAAENSDSRSSLFGFRTIKVEEGFRWLVNGKPYFVRGSNYLPSQWLSETLFPEIAKGKDHPFGGGAGGDFYSRDTALAKQANLNMLRVHAHVLPPEFHEACDRAGLLVWQDFPLQWGYSDEPGFQAEAERQMRAMVTLLYNHPSIAAWCCHNESPWDAPWMAGAAGGLYDPNHNRELDARLEAAARELDSTRYIHRNSGTGDGHVYPGWYVGHGRDFLDTPGAPFVTEYGAQGLPARHNVQRMVPQFGPESGHAELVQFKNWLDSLHKISTSRKALIEFGTVLWNFTERAHLKSIQNWMKGWGMKLERSTYKKIPPVEQTPEELHHARMIWETWRFHDFQPAETFDNGIQLGASLDEFIANSQAYQGQLIQFATECFRRAKYTTVVPGSSTGKVTGIIQFDFTDPWPAVTWSVLDYWRVPKPSFDALRRSMQPVLPSFLLPEHIEDGKATPTFFHVVNDLTESFPNATCEWRLSSEKRDVASAAFQVDIPADGVSTGVKLTLPSLGPGSYKLSVVLSSGGKILGENWYDIRVNRLQM